jgi:hypothetical protein
MVLVLLDSLLVTAEVIIDAENKDENKDAKVKIIIFNEIFTRVKLQLEILRFFSQDNLKA